jgi:hypothetical protein
VRKRKRGPEGHRPKTAARGLPMAAARPRRSMRPRLFVHGRQGHRDLRVRSITGTAVYTALAPNQFKGFRR